MVPTNSFPALEPPMLSENKSLGLILVCLLAVGYLFVTDAGKDSPVVAQKVLRAREQMHRRGDREGQRPDFSMPSPTLAAGPNHGTILTPEERISIILSKLEGNAGYEEKLSYLQQLRTIPYRSQVIEICLNELLQQQRIREDQREAHEKYLTEIFSILLEKQRDPRIIAKHFANILGNQTDEQLKTKLSHQFKKRFPAGD